MLEEVLGKAADAVHGALGVHLISLDGMPVASSPDPGGDPIDVVAASWADLVKKISAANEETDWEPPEELIMTCPSFKLLFRSITPEYALLAVLERAGSLGRARYELIKAAHTLRDEL
jgi:predicted regulator of Ras-like GTPase activity (Roadblock/LC7/MglB family)